MTLGSWVVSLFVVGTIVTCVGAFVASWWVMGPGMALFLASFLLTTWEREASEQGWRWPR